MPIPNNPDDLLLELDTPEKAARIFADPVARKDWLGGYVKAFNDANRAPRPTGCGPRPRKPLPTSSPRTATCPVAGSRSARP